MLAAGALESKIPRQEVIIARDAHGHSGALMWCSDAQETPDCRRGVISVKDSLETMNPNESMLKIF